MSFSLHFHNNHTSEVGEDKTYNLFLLKVNNLFQSNIYGTKKVKMPSMNTFNLVIYDNLTF